MKLSILFKQSLLLMDLYGTNLSPLLRTDASANDNFAGGMTMTVLVSNLKIVLNHLRCLQADFLEGPLHIDLGADLICCLVQTCLGTSLGLETEDILF